MGYSLLDKYSKEDLKRAFPDLNFDKEESNANQLGGQSVDRAPSSEPDQPSIDFGEMQGSDLAVSPEGKSVSLPGHSDLFDRASKVYQEKAPDMIKDVPFTDHGLMEGSDVVGVAPEDSKQPNPPAPTASPDRLQTAQIASTLKNESPATNFGDELKKAQAEMRILRTSW
jgi:hypothetical protein